MDSLILESEWGRKSNGRRKIVVCVPLGRSAVYIADIFLDKFQILTEGIELVLDVCDILQKLIQIFNPVHLFPPSPSG